MVKIPNKIIALWLICCISDFLQRWWWRFMLWIWRVRPSPLQSAFEHTWTRRSRNSNSLLHRFPTFLSSFTVSSSFLNLINCVHYPWECGISLADIKPYKYVFLPRLQGYLQKPCVWSWNAAIMTSGFSMFQIRHWKLRGSSEATRSQHFLSVRKSTWTL